MFDKLKRKWQSFPQNYQITFGITIVSGLVGLILLIITLLCPNCEWLSQTKTFIIPIIVAIVSLVWFVILALKDKYKREKYIQTSFQSIKSDKTTINFINDNNEITGCELSDYEHKRSRSLLRVDKEYVFIAITLTTDFLNIIHFAILAKLRQLQNYNIKPIIYLTIINKDDTNREKIKTFFVKLLQYYLIKPEIIMNEHKLSTETMNKLDETTIDDVLNKMPCDKRQMQLNMYLISIIMPFIENDIQQEKCAFVICGDDMKQFWTWDKIIRKKEKQPQLLFILPNLIGLDGNSISPKSKNNTLYVKFDLNDRTAGFTDISAFSNKIQEATNKEALLQIYAFLIFPLMEKLMPEQIPFKINLTTNTISTIDDIQSLSSVDISHLKNDLTQRTKELFNKLSNILIKK